MIEHKASKKTLVWTVLAVACVLFDVGLFVALGTAVKWLAGMASPFVWAGLALVAIAGARLLRLLDGMQLIRQERGQA